MENKKIYHTPLAQSVLFAPREDIGAFFGKNNVWWDNSAWWGLKAPENVSVVTGTFGIQDEDGKSWLFDGTMNQSN